MVDPQSSIGYLDLGMPFRSKGTVEAIQYRCRLFDLLKWNPADMAIPLHAALERQRAVCIEEHWYSTRGKRLKESITPVSGTPDTK
jgi:hypothetical protein